jgi:hypothetical protein
MIAFVRRYRVSVSLAVVALTAALAILFSLANWKSQPRADKPLTELRDGVFFITPDNYMETVGRLTKQNAVFIPAPQTETTLVSARTEVHGFVGAEQCRDCHASYVDSAAQTAHFRTCQQAEVASIPGSFETGSNILPTGNPEMFFRMSQSDIKYYQSLIVQRRGENYVHSESIDLVTGSAKYGQTFLYWQNQCLYELPVSHFTELGEWVNSPGYIDGVANFARPISSRCLECHCTWFEQSGTPFNRFISEGAILGVTCEKCHGPGRQHVEHHRSKPAATNAEHIINPGSLSIDRSIDLCSLCHSGAGETIGESFRFRPGGVEPLFSGKQRYAVYHMPQPASAGARKRQTLCCAMSEMSRCHGLRNRCQSGNCGGRAMYRLPHATPGGFKNAHAETARDFSPDAA